MVVRSKRTSSVRKVAKRLSKSVKIQYKRRKAKPKYRCAICGRVIKVRGRMHGRLFAGVLCHVCTDQVVRYAAQAKDEGLDSIPITYRPYVEVLIKRL